MTGAVDPARMLTNAGARPGDALILTKPLGTGIIGTAIKFDRADPRLVEEAVASMRTLNKAAAEALATIDGVHACTDITGFGLIGHARKWRRRAASRSRFARPPSRVFAGVLDIARKNRSGGMASNQEHFAAVVDVAAEVPPELRDLLYDPQTSGGLLVADRPARGSTGPCKS